MATSAAVVTSENNRRREENRRKGKKTAAQDAPRKQRFSRSPTMNLLHSTSRVHAEPAESRFKTPTGAEMSSLDAAIWNRRVNLQNRLQKWQEWWVIDPRTSKLIGYWDGVTVAALFFVALVTPFGAHALRSDHRHRPRPNAAAARVAAQPGLPASDGRHR
jgi:hypothetical protein